jgi:hypothetical protein
LEVKKVCAMIVLTNFKNTIYSGRGNLRWSCNESRTLTNVLIIADSDGRKYSMQRKPSGPLRPDYELLSKSNVKTILICFFRLQRDIAQRICPIWSDSAQKFYVQVLGRLRHGVPHVGPKLFPDKWILHDDSAPSYTALAVKEFLAKKPVVVLDRQPCWRYLAPCDLFFFHTMDNHLKRSQSETVE